MVSDAVFGAWVEAEAAGEATEAQVDALWAEAPRWHDVLVNLLADTEDALASVRSLTGLEREQVVADFEAERKMLSAALVDLERGRRGESSREPELQLSWSAGRLIAWAGNELARPASLDVLSGLLRDAGASANAWGPEGAVVLADGSSAVALSAPIGDVLGWTLGCGTRPGASASVRWFGQLAAWAMHLTARGSVVPVLRQLPRKDKPRASTGEFAVRWLPVCIAGNLLDAFVAAMPGSVATAEPSADAEVLTRAVLAGIVDVVCREAARLVEVAAPPPHATQRAEIAESYLTRLDGTTFDAPTDQGRDLARRIDDWARPVTEPLKRPLIIRLDKPDSSNAWHVSVLANGSNGTLVSVDIARVTSASAATRRRINDDLDRVERLLPELRRPGSDRRGETILTQGEAWELMSTIGQELTDAGFDVRVPLISRDSPRPQLRLSASDVRGTGASQLAHVDWSVLFDDVELTAADIARLAKEAVPLVHTNGRWVRLDDADLEAAAEALNQKSDTMTGGEMLRWALGLHDSPIAGGVVVDDGWVADLLEAARSATEAPMVEPATFRGTLRSYQLDALAWLQFCEQAALGGILALDMGLGKTPTVLAHIAETVAGGPTLVIAPPAVVGNWAAEAHKFTNSLRVVVHHGASRAENDEIAAEAAKADVILTTYGTAIRDLEALKSVTWNHIVLDEAQAIKNPSSETARGLRELNARTRIALTGTPIENGLGDLWSILDFLNPGLVGDRNGFVAQLSAHEDDSERAGEEALRALNGLLVFRRMKTEPGIADELPDQIDETDHCSMTTEQIGLYQAVLDKLLLEKTSGEDAGQGRVLGAITALKQICNHPAAYTDDDGPLEGRSGKLARLEEIVEAVGAADEGLIVFTQYAKWGQRMADYLTTKTGVKVPCYHGGLARGARRPHRRRLPEGRRQQGAGALDEGRRHRAQPHRRQPRRALRPLVEPGRRGPGADRAWRIGQQRTVISHRLVCPGTIDDRVEEVVNGKRRIANLVLPKSSSPDDLDAEQIRQALGLRPDEILTEEAPAPVDEAAA